MQNRLLFSAVHLNSHVFTVLHSCKVIKLYVRHLFFYFINFFICFNLRSWKDIKDISAYYWNKRQPTKTAKINFQNSWFKSGSRSRSKKVKFIHSEKATKFCEISTIDLTGTKGKLYYQLHISQTWSPIFFTFNSNLWKFSCQLLSSARKTVC